MTDDCPPIGTLREMLDDRLLGNEAIVVEEHVALCSSCQESLERLTSESSNSSETAWNSQAKASNWGIEPSNDSAATGSFGETIPELPGYRIERELGRGGMGIVYLARQLRANRMVAVKMLAPGRRRQEDAFRFRLEAESLARLKHPNVVRIYEVGTFQDQPYFSMEYVAGGTLADALAAHSPRPREAAEIAESLARGVHAAHQCGVVHRDLKPHNVLIEPGPTSSPSERLKVTDFGLAKHEGDDSSLTQTGQILGTPSYMAPEQALGGASVGMPADIYALGAILYEMLCGCPPFRRRSPWETMMAVVHEPPVPPSRQRPGVPRDLEVIALKCLAKDPKDRYPSAHALAEELRRWLDGLPIQSRPAGTIRRMALWCRRHPAPAALSAALVIALVVGTVVSTSQWLLARERTREAEASADRARRAVNDLLTEVGQNRLIREPGMQDLRRSLLQAAIPYYREFADSPGSGPKAQAALAEALIRLAQIEYDLGSITEARALSTRALAAASGDDRASRIARAQILRFLGLIKKFSGEIGPALETNGESVALLEALYRHTPQDGSVEKLLVNALQDRGGLLTVVDRAEESEATLRRIITLTGEKRDAGARLSLAATRKLLGDMLMRRPGRQADAIAELEAAVAMNREILDERPDDIWAAEDLATSLLYLGEAQEMLLGQFALATETLEQGRELAAPLARDNPLVTSFRHNLGLFDYTLGYSKMRLGRYDEALKHQRSALELIGRVARDNPDEVRFQSPGLSGIHQDLAELARLTGDTEGARQSVAETKILLDAVTAAAPDDPTNRLNSGMIHRYAGAIEADAGNASIALAQADTALAIVEPLASGPSAAAHYREECDRIRIIRAVALRMSGRSAEAQKDLDLAARDLAGLVAQDPTAVERRVLLVEALARRAAALHALGRDDEALSVWLRARETLDPTPSGPDGLHVLAILHSVRAMLPAEPRAGDPAKAADQALEALRSSASAGYRNAPALQNDPDLAPVRTRPDIGVLISSPSTASGTADPRR